MMALDDFDPDEAIYDLYLDEVHIARLYEPRFEEMFWCSYRVEATNAENDIAIHGMILVGVDYKILDKQGNEPNPHTFAAPCEDFCARRTDRQMFRSLWPPEPPALPKPPNPFIRWIKSSFLYSKK